jgi:outer membrane lipoprotein-sorting protein
MRKPSLPALAGLGLMIAALSLTTLDHPVAAQGAPKAAAEKPGAPLSLVPGGAGPAATPAAEQARVTGGPVGPRGLDAGQRALVEKVNAYLTSVNTMVGDFVQVGPDGRKTEGKLYLQKPGRVRFEYDPPSPIELIADGQSVVVRDRKLATQDLYPLSQTPLRFLLADRIDLARDTNVAAVYADDTFVTVVIDEKQVIGGTHRLMMMFSAKDMQLKQWTVTDPQGYDTTVAVYNLETGRKLDQSLFKINYERVLQ